MQTEKLLLFLGREKLMRVSVPIPMLGFPTAAAASQKGYLFHSPRAKPHTRALRITKINGLAKEQLLIA
jgi:hypothetical protein